MKYFNARVSSLLWTVWFILVYKYIAIISGEWTEFVTDFTTTIQSVAISWYLLTLGNTLNQIFFGDSN